MRTQDQGPTTTTPLYLGVDASTQSLTLQAIEVGAGRGHLVFEHAVVFDRDLPEYGTRHGVLPSDDPRVAVAPPLMWADALDRAMAAMAASGLDCSRVAALSGSAQQHGSVYLNGRASGRLGALDPSRPLAPQLDGIFARPVSPIWLDRSTTQECEEITRAVGGAARLASLTGSRAFERFTAAQIRKCYKREPEAYAASARIQLVSSFLASLLTGADAPLDPGDASGMNLMDLARRGWANVALEATAPGLAAKLPAIVPPDTVAGRLAPYWRQRYGVSDAAVVVWSGDNPSSVIGTGLVEEGRVAISLGTSDTIFGLMRTPRVDPTGTGHVFGAPTGAFMGLTVFSNGSLARERIRDAFQLDWQGFAAALEATPPGIGGAIMLPWFVPEITPPVPTAGVHRVNLDAGNPSQNVRAVVEAQMMSMMNHSRWMGVDVRTIHATGGASANRAILQVMADVFGAEVYQFPVGNSACLGAALRAWHADAKARGGAMGWTEIIRGLAEPVATSRVAPVLDRTRMYAKLRERYAEIESRHVRRESP
ncbi:MAG TPA: FGGY-family carbohydrate kinase [Vicinamibacterales bacterium]|nr:FGGY-family carbohydrate kinase [Vicinamibacterales bacterium]